MTPYQDSNRDLTISTTKKIYINHNKARDKTLQQQPLTNPIVIYYHFSYPNKRYTIGSIHHRMSSTTTTQLGAECPHVWMTGNLLFVMICHWWKTTTFHAIGQHFWPKIMINMIEGASHFMWKEIIIIIMICL